MTKEHSLIELPEASDIKEILAMAKKDIAEEVKNNEELKEPSELLKKVIASIEEKIEGNIAKFSDKERIDLAAHLNFLHTLLEDFFFDDEEFFEDFEDEDYESEEDEE